VERSSIAMTGFALALVACAPNPDDRYAGQTSFVSSPGHLAPPDDDVYSVRLAWPLENPRAPIYSLQGNRLYMLNGYRGLLVFDVTDIDHPRLIGRAPFSGWPMEMVVLGTVATVVLADWYGENADGSPFYGSVVRRLDVSDATNIRQLEDLRLGGWVLEARVVGSVLYTVSEAVDSTWDRIGGRTVSPPGELVVTSVDLSATMLRKAAERTYPLWTSPPVLAVASSATALVLLYDPPGPGPFLTYLDISDPAGSIVERGSFEIQGVRALGPAGLDFSDGKTIQAFPYGFCISPCPWSFVSVDFSNPDVPAETSRLTFPDQFPAGARFDSGRMYVWSGSHLQLLDLTDRRHPRLAAELEMAGQIWELVPAGSTLLAVAERLSAIGASATVTAVDVTDLANLKVADVAAFGQDWTFVPDARMFKPPAIDDVQGLIALPFSAWDGRSFVYRNGVQLLQRSAGSTGSAGLVTTQAWIEGAFFAGARLLALSDASLAVIDPSVPQAPRLVTEQQLARNVTRALPMGDFVVQFSSDFWGRDFWTDVRVLPLAEADEPPGAAVLSELRIDGVPTGVFQNGSLLYVLTSKLLSYSNMPGANGPTEGMVLHVLDLSGALVRLRSRLVLPPVGRYPIPVPPGWSFDNAHLLPANGGAVQIASDAVALKLESERPLVYRGGGVLLVLDLSKPDAPTAAAISIRDGMVEWGHLVVRGDALYVTETEPVQPPDAFFPRVRYWLDRIDLSDRAHPKVASRVNVTGLLIESAPVGDPSLIYVKGLRWITEETPTTEGRAPGREIYSLDMLRVHGDRAELLGSVDFDGVPGPLFFSGDRALLSVAEIHGVDFQAYRSQTLHVLDVSDPARPTDRVIDARESRRWFLDLEGDHALFTAGWGGLFGLDVCRLGADGVPRYERFLRGQSSVISRQANDLFVASGPWGVETVHVGP